MKPGTQRIALLVALVVVGIIGIVLTVYISLLIAEMKEVDKFCDPAQGAIDVPKSGATYLQSLNYNSSYPPNKDCIYVLRAPKGMQIEINSLHFNMESGSTGTCSHDRLTFSEYSSGASIGEGAYCGIRGPVNLISATDKVRVTFWTDNTNQHAGFKILLKASNPKAAAVFSKIETISTQSFLEVPINGTSSSNETSSVISDAGSIDSTDTLSEGTTSLHDGVNQVPTDSTGSSTDTSEVVATTNGENQQETGSSDFTVSSTDTSEVVATTNGENQQEAGSSDFTVSSTDTSEVVATTNGENQQETGSSDSTISSTDTSEIVSITDAETASTAT